MRIDEAAGEHEPTDINDRLGLKSGLVRVSHKADAITGDGDVLPDGIVSGAVVDQTVPHEQVGGGLGPRDPG